MGLDPQGTASAGVILGPAAGTFQFLRPVSDITSGTWTPSTGATLYGVLDETVADDGDYDYSSFNPSTDVAEVKLTTGSDPFSSTGHIVRYRIKGDGSTPLAVALICNTTVIHTWTHNPADAGWTLYEQTLSGTDADAITDYADLRLRVTAG